MRGAVRFGLGLLTALLATSSLAEMATPDTFKLQQMRFQRVREASNLKEASLRQLFAKRKLDYPPSRLLIRAFKRERLLQVWVGDAGASPLSLAAEYRFCATSGTLGPKRRMGDNQIPEGFYVIDRFNPVSNYHLSLGVNYPNASDRILGAKGRLGGDIFIHGGCATIGCIPITDDGIRELYLLAIEARSAGRADIQVHIFPSQMNERGMTQLRREYAGDARLIEFWENLKPGYDLFEKNRKPPLVTVDRGGKYLFGPVR
jgi:murein L,D-transpeptidase YafK